jgi:Ca2+:H+ antiporter
MTSSAVMPIKSSKFKDQAVIFVKMKKAELRMKHLIRQRDSIQMKTPEEQGILIPEDAEGGRRDNLSALMQIVVFDPISIMLVFWPIGWASSLLEWADAITFATNFLAMIPLAKILGDATEELAAGLKNDTVGGLLNATFGNAVEMILTVQMLRENKIEVVKGTLLGSILSNLLLVLGMSFFAGGLTQRDGTRMNKEQTFSPGAALTNMTMLLIATCAFALPTVFFQLLPVDDEGLGKQLELTVSRWCSTYILSAYMAFLFFQLYTHVNMFKSNDDEEDVEAQLSPWVSTMLLFVTTCFVSLTSELLVDSIDGIVKDWNIGQAFIGVILLPIVGNACEHAGAVRMAIHDKVDITIGIAVGSSTQVALFVVPFSVLVGWMMNVEMDLNLNALNVTVLMFSVLICFSILSDGSSNWLEGYMLMIAYLVVATLFWFVPEDSLM